MSETRTYILPKDHPFWPDQQAFLEIATSTQETNSERLLIASLKDYQRVFGAPPGEPLMELFQEWAVVFSQINREIEESGGIDRFWNEKVISKRGQE